MSALGEFLLGQGGSLHYLVQPPKLSRWIAGTKFNQVSIGATYGFSKSAAANLREKDDSWNPAIGGFLAGSIGGLRSEWPGNSEADELTGIFVVRSFPHTVGFGAGLAVLQGVFDFTGGKFSGYERDPELNEYERREQLRKQRRRPIQETLDELGEGRGELPSYTSLSNGKAPLTAPTGIYGPGYRQRRADRIKDAYGIDVPRT